MSTDELMFAVNCGRIETQQMPVAIELIGQNPFGQVDTLIDDSDGAAGDSEAFTPQRLLEIAGGQTWNVTLFGKTGEESVSVDLIQRAGGATVAVTVTSARLRGEYAAFLEYAQRWVAALPELAHGRIYDTRTDIVELYRELDLKRPPACFTTRLRWVHFLGPQYYSLYFTTEDLLATPAASVQKLHNDVVQIMLHDDPFSFDSDAGRRILVEATQYLNDRDRFMDQFR